ncbi:urea-proton symporter DUR3, partial [Biomphalaria pfeifferi]
DQVDTSFDAGGNVNAGLTATTIVSQWTWAATLLQSSAVAAKYGISGSFWYASGATIQILLFSMLSVQLKTRAPGAKTFLQVIRARFGKSTHIVFCIFALATNVIVTAMLML